MKVFLIWGRENHFSFGQTLLRTKCNMAGSFISGDIPNVKSLQNVKLDFNQYKDFIQNYKTHL